MKDSFVELEVAESALAVGVLSLVVAQKMVVLA